MTVRADTFIGFERLAIDESKEPTIITNRWIQLLQNRRAILHCLSGETIPRHPMEAAIRIVLVHGAVPHCVIRGLLSVHRELLSDAICNNP